MKTIDLHDYYIWIKTGTFIMVTDEVAEALRDSVRSEVAQQVREYRYKAYYSLDRSDGIESGTLQAALPDEIAERRRITELLYAAITSLPDKQAKRIYSHFFLGMSCAAIARTERSDKSNVRKSINGAVRNIKKYLQKLL